MIYLHDTMSGKKQAFEPADPNRITMYVCGPTVYGRAHIGNARPAVVFDTLARLIRHTYGKHSLVYARNVTDVDDKIIDSAKKEGVDTTVITHRYERLYLEDMGALGVQPPDIAPHATQEIDGMKEMICALIAKGHAYHVPGHEVLFDIASVDRYPALSRQALNEMQVGDRAERLPYKRNEFDFVLWKPSDENTVGWESPWGRGRPGWHIECSAMIRAHLGETIDIHGGGLDLIFPHHENEIAQSCCANDAPLAHYWLHNGFVSMAAEKMSKSLGNIKTVGDILADGWTGQEIRFALISAHYRQPLEWSEQGLNDARVRLQKYRVLRKQFRGLGTLLRSDNSILRELNDDLNTPAALARLHELYLEADSLMNEARSLLRDISTRVVGRTWAANPAQRLAIRTYSQFYTLGRLLGVFDPRLKIDQPARLRWFAESGIEAREKARKMRDFDAADRIRDFLKSEGILLEDGPTGTTWRKA